MTGRPTADNVRPAPRVLVLVLLGAALAPAAMAQDSQATSRPLSRDAALWQRIETQHQALVPGGKAPTPTRVAIQKRLRLLSLVRSYLSSYPGGVQRERALRIELETLFEIGVLRGGDFKPLAQRIEQYLRHPPCSAAADEAAWWAIVARRLQEHAGGPPPASGPLGACDKALLESLRAYVKRCPKGRHVPSAMRLIFADAARRHDLDRMNACVERLRKGFPHHLVTRDLAAERKRYQAAGKPFVAVLSDAAGRQVPVASWRGHPLLIVVWAGCNGRARSCAREIEAFRREHPDLRVVGVNLDASPEIGFSAARELALPWEQFNDGLGFANVFARTWGVRHVPLVFAVDRGGKLIGTAGAARWRPLAEQLLRPTR